MRWFALLVLCACGDDASTVDDAPTLSKRVLAYSRTLGHRHDDAIVAATQVLPQRLAAEKLDVDFTEDPAQFTLDNLERYRAVIFLYTTGNDILEPDGKAALETFVGRGGGWLGIHSAADTEYMWPFYQRMVVSHFVDHPGIQTATVAIAAPSHAAMVNVPVGPWIAADEWYNFKSNPRASLGVDVLATVDEATYTGGTMGTDHPVIWAQERLSGRTLYTSLGHVAERWQEPAFVEHIASSLRWVTGLAL
jgi:type 1 glutamine amidotransferase